jgi:CHAT domain-containing protein
VADEVKIVGEVRKLEPGERIEVELKGGEGHVYDLTVQADQMIHLAVEQQGIDVALQIRAPEEGISTRVDSPSGANGPEHFFALPERAGLWRLEVRAEDAGAAAGRYRIELDPLRPATVEDRKQVEAWTLFNDGESLRRDRTVESLTRSIEKYQAALSLWRSLGNAQDWEAEALYRLGWVHQDLSDYQEALTFLENALPLYRRLGKPTEEGILLNRIGIMSSQLGRWSEARTAQEQAAQIFHRIGRSELESEALSAEAFLDGTLGEVQKALDKYREALALARQVKVLDSEGVALAGIGEMLIYQGKLAEALDNLGDALPVLEAAGRPADKARVLARMADVYHRLNRLPEARSRLEEALEIQRQRGDRTGQAITLNSLGTVYLLLKQVEDGGKAYQAARDLFHATHDPIGEAFSLLNLGRYRYAAGDARQALQLHDQAADLFHNLGNPRGEVSTLYGSARALHDLGDFAGAQERLERVLAHLESLRSESESVDLRASYLATRQHYFELYIDVLMHLDELHPDRKYAEKAFQINEQRQARSLLDSLLAARGSASQEKGSASRSAVRSLQDELARNVALLAGQSGKISKEQRAALEKRQRELLIDLDQARVGKNPRAAALASFKPLDVATIQEKLLNEKTSLLVYSLGEERSFLWYVPPQGELVSRALPARRAIEGEVEAVLRAWRKPDGDTSRAGERRAERLSQDLLGKVQEHLATKRLLIAGDGILWYLPFAALPDPSHRAPLVNTYQIINIPSATVLLALREQTQKRMPASRRIAVLANPAFGPGNSAQDGTSPSLSRSSQDLEIDHFESLPYTADEAALIRQLVPEKQRFEALELKATRRLVLDGALRGYRILHFATHGLLNAQHPELSGIVLSLIDERGEPQNGFLLAGEISDLDLPAELVVLSACETGLGAEIKGEGLVGLTQSFMHAGAPRVIVSLWKVGDHGTAELMKRFYRGIFKFGFSYSGALRCAQLSMREDPRWRSRYHWAPFIFVGDWSQAGRSDADDSIEKQTAGTPVGGRPDDDLPPPTSGCPSDLAGDT